MFQTQAPAAQRLVLLEDPMPESDGHALYGTRACIICGTADSVWLLPSLADRILAGDPIQDILPDTPAADREVIATGTHPDCWARTLGTKAAA